MKLSDILFKFNYLIFLGCGLCYTTTTRAECNLIAGTPITTTIPINTGFLSAGNDAPIGTVIGRQTINGFNQVNINCGSDSRTYGAFKFEGGTLNLSTSTGDMYETGIPNLVMRVRLYENYYAPHIFVINDGEIGSGLVFLIGGFLKIDVEFVKLGPIQSGGTINGSSLPKIITYAISSNSPSNTYTVANYSFSGSLTYNTPTCTTPDYEYNLGSHNVNTLSTLGSSTAWVATPITLTACGIFYGNNNADNSMSQYTVTGTNSGTDFTNNLTKNYINVDLLLPSGVQAITGTTGLISGNSSSSAANVGVQIGYKPSEAESYAPFDITSTATIRPDLSTSGNFSFPFAARLYRYDSPKTSGQIKSSITYVISYQ